MTTFFISYASANAPIVQRLSRDLQLGGVPLWIDKQGLKPGTHHWEQAIRDAIQACMGVIYLASPQARQSPYVFSELQLAQQAGKTIYPIWIEGEHYLDCIAMGFTAIQMIDARAERYDTGLDSLLQQLSYHLPPNLSRVAETKPRAHSYPTPYGVTLHIATGDITAMPGLDAVVNSENDWMVMARPHEASLSARLRWLGSHVVADKQKADSVQRELDEVLAGEDRPVPLCSIVPTSSGHPDGALRQVGYRFIFHAATIHLDPHERRATPIEGALIDDVVEAVLKRAAAINLSMGMDAPTKRQWRSYQGAVFHFEYIRSIILPLIGTGAGGLPLSRVLPRMMDGLRRYLQSMGADGKISDIHLCAYREAEVLAAQQAMDAAFKS